MDISTLRDILTKDIITVTFLKKDGSVREMLCTLMSAHLPEMQGPSTSKPTPGLLTVWDLENGWRSIKFDSIQQIFTEDKIYDLGQSTPGNT
jgi:hypothetical protein